MATKRTAVRKKPLGSSTGHTVLAPTELNQAAQRVMMFARQQGVRAAIAGGYAMQAYGSTRLTSDLDIVAAGALVALKVGPLLSFGGYQTTVDNVPVDIILRDDDFAPLYAEALTRAARTTELPGKLPTITPPYLALMKMVAGRSKDMDDIARLIAGGLDVVATRKIARRLLGAYAAIDFDSIVQEAKWRIQTKQI